MFDYVLKQAHGPHPAGTRVRARRNEARDIIVQFDDGEEKTLSGALYCLMGEDLEAALTWWLPAVEGLQQVTGKPRLEVETALRDLMYALQVDIGPARNNPRWRDRNLFDRISEMMFCLTEVERLMPRLKE